ncbi:helix-turn-helix transcriptional regulator [Clostridium sp. NSJ-6]|uniref:Helix-turn-helix transcriptional regulator n=1 Tax=Clostridium hominis TaxID=2763036 RepID=A0ABR7DCD6_9CLOT|nr:helix-turn-helix transcriptional regulator [Clostridium hominis]MBC5629059.1 helix-turn-helix transcriptional regulator [Clostridium hominis]MDU2671881.1 helix-turn-helix transcriptional regulator [Clostridium sp.]
MDFYKYKDNKKIIGSIIKFNRINQNMSQKALSKGICVASYLSRIESGDLIPSEEVISIIFTRLGLSFNDSEEFLEKGIASLKLFFDKLHFNEFDLTNKLFNELESQENDYITSPLVIDYFLAKLARYCSTPNREKFESSKSLLHSSFELLSPQQKFLYNFYVGVDELNLSQDKSIGKNLIEQALNYKDNGHCYFWLSYAYRIENNPIKSYDCIKKALDLYVSEGNIISIMSCYEKIAEVHFMLDNYSDAIEYLKISLSIAEKLNNKYFIEHLNSIISWAYYRLKDCSTSLTYLKNNTGLVDHRMLVPDSITESLIYFSLNNKALLKNSIQKLKNAQSLEHINEDLANRIYKLFNLYIEDDDYLKNPNWENLLIYIIDNMHKLVELKKVFITLLKEYYIYNRKYKDALFL